MFNAIESEDRFSVKKHAVDNIARQLDDVKDIESKLLLENENLAEEIKSLREFVVQQGNLPIEVRQAIDSSKRSGKLHTMSFQHQNSSRLRYLQTHAARTSMGAKVQCTSLHLWKMVGG